MNDNDEPMEFLWEQKVPNDRDQDLVECQLSLQVSVESSEGVGMVRPWLIVEEGDKQEY